MKVNWLTHENEKLTFPFAHPTVFLRESQQFLVRAAETVFKNTVVTSLAIRAAQAIDKQHVNLIATQYPQPEMQTFTVVNFWMCTFIEILHK